MTRRLRWSSLQARIVTAVVAAALAIAGVATFLAFHAVSPALEFVDFGGDEVATHERLAHSRYYFAALDIGALVLALIVGFVVAALVRRPVRRATLAAERLGNGDLDVRLSESGSAELTELARSFNEMAQRMADTMGELRMSQTLQQRFVADVSHELRTPLAAMLAASDRLDDEDPAVRARATALVRGQTRRMNRMVEDLLEMSRLDAGQTALLLEPVALDELAHDVVRTVASEHDIRVTTFGDVVVDVDARRVHAILRNLVGNAIQHGAPPVDIVIDGHSDPVAVTVADDGPGVPPELAATVFDRFVRADTSRTGGGSSTGLGLAIAAENVRLHGATLTVSTSGRSSFTVRLPRRRE